MSDAAVAGTVPAIFVCDAASARDARFLTDWVRDNHEHGRDTAARWVTISLDGARMPRSRQLREALAQSPPETPVIPTRLGWNPERDTEDSTPRLRDLLLGDPTRPRNQFARRLRRNDPSRARYIVGQSATIAELRARNEAEVAGHDSPGEDFTAFVARHADLALDVEERGLRGRRYKVPRFVIPGIEARAEYRIAVAETAKDLGRSAAEVQLEARTYLAELVATPTTFFIDWMGTLTRWITSLGYKRVVTDPANVERARAMMRDYPTALLWTHKSYIDAIALMSVMYDNDFPAPHSIGGINMAFAGVGYAGRRSGTIFIRRKFNDNPVYKLALRQYLGFLMAKGFPLSWSFEGTRSRNGTLGRPRYGLLKYAIDAAHATGTEDLHLIPVSINYDLIGETADYALEESGRPKQAESLSWFVEYLRRLRAPMGNIYLDFGEPVVLEGPAQEPTRELLQDVSFQVARRADACVPVTVASLLSLVLLGTQPRALTRDEIDTAMRDIVRWLKAHDVRLENTLVHGDMPAGETLFDNASNTGVFRRTTEASVELIGIGRGQDLVASYYRNTIVHYFTGKAIAEIAVALSRDAAPGSRAETVLAEAEALRVMLQDSFYLPGPDEFRAEVDGLLREHDADWAATIESAEAESADPAGAFLDGFTPLIAHATVLPFIEARWIVATVVAGLAPGDTPDKQEIIGKALRYGRTARERQLIVGEASVGKAMLEAGLAHLAGTGALGTDALDADADDPADAAGDVIGRRRTARARLEAVLDAIGAIRTRAHAQLFDGPGD